MSALPPYPVQPPVFLSLLSALHESVGRSRIGRGLLRGFLPRRLVRAWLRRAFIRSQLDRPDHVTVLMGIRNRTDYRIANALRSIREQTLRDALIRIMVVDYGSEPEAAELTSSICRNYRAEYIRVDRPGVWSRSRCLNVGVRRAETTFLMTSDADILLSPTYLSDAIAALNESPLSVICSPMMDLPRRSTELVRRAAEEGEPLRLREWREWCRPRLDWQFHPSITVTYTLLHQVIRGYDEFYELWGDEDLDLLRRLERLGLEVRLLESGAFYLHQWHPKYENIPRKERERGIRRNREHFERNRSIVRNDAKWGRPGVAVSDRTWRRCAEPEASVDQRRVRKSHDPVDLV